MITLENFSREMLLKRDVAFLYRHDEPEASYLVLAECDVPGF